MGIGVSIFLLAVGAILAFAVDVTTRGLDLNAIGVILMVVGAIGLFASFVFWDSMGFGGYSRRRSVVRNRYVDLDDEPVVVASPRARTGYVRERHVIEEDV